MSTRDELFAESVGEVVKHELDGKTYRFKRPTVEQHQKVMNVGGLTALPSLNRAKATKPEAPRTMALGKMKVHSLIESLLDGETDRYAFTVADVEALMTVPIGSKIERLASWAWENLFADKDDETNEAGENP
ncbi:MAG TPA: hypothetical protein PLV92_03275 [Pirellulaceae bacterium]|nr:hypothetical protein [Pirellulaceae bacterium]